MVVNEQARVFTDFLVRLLGNKVIRAKNGKGAWMERSFFSSPDMPHFRKVNENGMPCCCLRYGFDLK